METWLGNGKKQAKKQAEEIDRWESERVRRKVHRSEKIEEQIEQIRDILGNLSQLIDIPPKSASEPGAKPGPRRRHCYEDAWTALVQLFAACGVTSVRKLTTYPHALFCAAGVDSPFKPEILPLKIQTHNPPLYELIQTYAKNQ